MATKNNTKNTTKEEKERRRRASQKANTRRAVESAVSDLDIEEKNSVLSKMLKCRPQDFRRIKISRKYYDIVRKITLNVPITKLAAWCIQKDPDTFGDISESRLKNMLYAFKDHLINRVGMGDFPNTVFDMIADRVETEAETVLKDKEKALAIQKSRLEYALIEEEENLSDMSYRANVRAELRLFNDLTNELIEKRQSLGLEVYMGGVLPMSAHQQNNTLVQNLIVNMNNGHMSRLDALKQIKQLITQKQNAHETTAR